MPLIRMVILYIIFGGGELEYTQTELKILGICSVISGVFSFLVGGIDLPVASLLALILIDFLTGLYAGWVNCVVSSQRGYNGLKRKIFILVVICLANLIDNSMSLNHMFRSMMICGYSAMEGISICENLGRMGYGDMIPQVFRDKLVQIRDEKGIKL